MSRQQIPAPDRSLPLRPHARHVNAVLSPAAFHLLSRLGRAAHHGDAVPEAVRRSVAVLTAAADPAHADRLRPRAGEPAVLVMRLASWALHRVDDAVVAAAARQLDADASTAYAA